MMRFTTALVGLFLVGGLVFCPSLLADVIHLKNGDSLEVRTWRDVGDAIEFNRYGGVIRISKDEILRIDRGRERTSPPSAGTAQSARQLVEEGHALSRAEAESLENQLKSDPDDLSTRARLLGYYFAGSLRQSGPAATLEARRRHIFWLIQKRPDAEILEMSDATIDPAGHALADPEGYRQARALWRKQIQVHTSNTAVLRHAVKFFQLPDKELAEEALKLAQAAEPESRGWTVDLGYLYALGIMGINGLNQNGFPTSVNAAEAVGAFAKKARRALDTSTDAAQVGTAGSIMAQYGPMIRAMGMTQQDYTVLAEAYLKRAQQLEPQSPRWSEALMGLYNLQGMVATTPTAKTALAKKALEQAEGSARGVDPRQRFHLLGDLAKAAFDAGDFKKAVAYANELLDAASKRQDDSWYGTAIHQGNLVLGRVALRTGDTQKAKAWLLKAGETPGGGTLDSFGPNMALAKELLERGEKDTVIQYLELCKRFWKNPALDAWLQSIKAGGTPEFGGNLVY